jgi:hypothetical protein
VLEEVNVDTSDMLQPSSTLVFFWGNTHVETITASKRMTATLVQTEGGFLFAKTKNTILR